jgi:hypothetical protein
MTRSKYNARKTEVDSHTFDSLAESRRYSELKLLEKAGEISGLELQPRYPIVVNGVKVCEYRADFRYFDRGQQVVEDVKGFRTDVYQLKKKLVKACYLIDIMEVTA